jgi:hypothetical protein
VREVLSNEKYIGNNVYNRRSFKLKKVRVVNSRRCGSRRKARSRASCRRICSTPRRASARTAHRYSDEELIEKLRGLYQQHGYLSGLIIDEAEGMPSAAAYAHRFGSLIRAYQTVGFTPDRDYQYLEVNQFLRRLHPEIVGQTERMIAEVGGAVVRDPATDLLTVNHEFTVSLVLARCQLLDNGRRRWKVRFDTSLAPDITVAVRLDETNQARWTTTCCRVWISASHASIWPTTTASSSRATASTAWTTCTAWPAQPHTEGRMTRTKTIATGIADDPARSDRRAQPARAQQPCVRGDRRQHQEHRPEEADHRDATARERWRALPADLRRRQAQGLQDARPEGNPGAGDRVDDEDAFIMSLTENIARRKFSPLELLDGIEQLRDQGYDKKSSPRRPA